MATKVGINGFGRIGRNFFRACAGRDDIEIVQVNDITDAATLAHLLKYDSTFGVMQGEITAGGNSISINGKELRITAERDPAKLPWKEAGVEIVVESTGLFTRRADSAKHIEAGAKKVVISAPAKDEDVTIVLGVNQDDGHHKQLQDDV